MHDRTAIILIVAALATAPIAVLFTALGLAWWATILGAPAAGLLYGLAAYDRTTKTHSS